RLRHDLGRQPDRVEALADLLNSARKVTILCGSGCAGARDELLALGDALKAPMVHAIRGKEHVEWDNPYDVGMTGLIGFSSGYRAMLSCDALLMLGTDFPYRQFYPTDAKIAQVDIDGVNLGKRAPIDLGVVGDVKATLQTLLPHIKMDRSASHLDDCVAHYKNARKDLDDLAVGKPGQKPIHPQYVAKIVSEQAADDAIFTCDVGTPTIWAARYLAMNGKRRLLGSFNHGSMANALMQAIGAQAAFPQRQVVALAGDGGFGMMMGEFLTLRQLGLPVKVVIFNNSTLGFVEMEMKAAGFLDTGVELDNPDFGKIASDAGLFGARVEDPSELESALASALAHPGPAIIDVVTNRLELAMPPQVTSEMAKGFSLYSLRAIINGRGSDLIELARSNLLR
ncbi:MAG: thiamine pyrophosphate-dependent enzyme, partial [Pseudomonadota bacterium]